MANADLNTIVGTVGQGYRDGVQPNLLVDGSGSLVVMDFYTKAILDGRGWQVRAGTITTPLVGDVVITDTAAEFCIDTGANPITLIPFAQQIAVRLGTGTLHEYASKEVSTASTAGTAFVPLAMKAGTTGVVSTARVGAAGGVTVTAELATTTLRHWSYSQPIAMGAYSREIVWEPRTVIVKGSAATPRCFYVQVAATGTGPSYYAHLNYLEFPNALLGGSY